MLDALEVDAADVVGWSAGGRIGAALAAARPDVVRSLAIVVDAGHLVVVTAWADILAARP